MRFTPLVAFAALALAAPRPAIDAQSSDPIFERLAPFVMEKMKEHEVPGVSIGVLHAGRVDTRGFGVTNVEHPLPVTDETVFQVGSISKTFTGTMMMRLVEQGRVRLDAAVRTYLPGFRVRDETASRDATVADLLTHMGGWEGDIFEDTGEGEDAVAKYVAQLKDVEQVAPLRSVWSYNNAGFVVAGRIVEVVTGQTYERALQELVLTPLALVRTYITPSDVMTRRFAVGHGPRGATVLRPWPIGRYAHAAGGVICTAVDLLKYAQFHLGDGTSGGTRVLGSSTLQQMHRTAFVKQGMDGEMAITWHVSSTDGVRQVGHGGGTLGQVSHLSLVPQRNFAIAILTNSAGGGRLIRDVSRWALKEYLAVNETDPAAMAAQPAVAAYAGKYSRPFAEVVISAENERLFVQTIPKRGFPNASAPVPPPGPKLPVAFYAPDRLVITDGPQKGGRIEFIRGTGGSLGWVRVGGRIHKRAGATS
jgi:CubicO group peptidase (beta-lactamase class C family)